MINNNDFKIGEKVHYQPSYFADEKFENGIVKSFAPNGGIFVVYNCAGMWDHYQNYTAANTSPRDLKKGWK